ncbi:hypothetical protein ACLESD_32880 [Pyxidicoccus sp. 3LFB2]
MRPSAPELDLTQCDREPIHLLGGVQPHGVLLAFREPDLTVEVVSANTEGLLGLSPQALRGQPVTRVLDADSLGRVRVGTATGARAREGRRPRLLRAAAHRRGPDGAGAGAPPGRGRDGRGGRPGRPCTGWCPR